MSKLTKALTAAAGNAGGAGLTVEDVFSTYLYEGTGKGVPITITNGIDLAGEGGLVWSKDRGTTARHSLINTATPTEFLSSNTTDASGAGINLSANSDGYSLDGYDFYNIINIIDRNYASWTFRKAEKFFDVVTYTGDGVAGREIAHNLNSVPACIIVKNISLSGYYWQVYHTSTGNTDYLNLNDADATASFIGAWNNTSPTSTHFTLGNWAQTNDAAGSTYVAYLFASDAGGFGDDGSESIIKCGSVTADGSGNVAETNLGFEPQWVLYKRTDGTSPWYVFDTMRGLVTGSDPSSTNNFALYPNVSNAETQSGSLFQPTATGFGAEVAGANSSWIYIAIRRPMKTPESGTEVFSVNNGDGVTVPGFTSGFPVDMAWERRVNNTDDTQLSTRLLGETALKTNTTGAEASASGRSFDYMDGWLGFAEGVDWYSWMFKRATGFFDVVAYTGTGTAGSTQAHNLGAAPELMIVKSRSNGAYNWMVYHHSLGNTNYLRLNETTQTLATAGAWNNTTPTDSEFTLGGGSVTNGSGETFIAYLFATLAGVSKVGSYTGTGADLNVDCGFSAGARFILIKRTDSTGDWYVWDSVRGIVAGNDPYFLLNSTAAEVTSTDYIDPLSSGFTVTSSAPAALNASGGTYIFLAIA